MIEIEFLKTKDEKLKGFNICGHAMSGAFGSDIVCAAVSSVAYMVANTIIEILKIDASVTIESGNMLLEILDIDADKCKDILLGLKIHLISLQEQYPQNIKVKGTEE